MTDWKALCEELANYLQGRKDREIGWPGEDLEQDLLDRVHSLLAQSEPEVAGVTDEELLEMARTVDLLMEDGSTGYLDFADVSHLVLAFARAVLARWGRPAPAPAGEVGELVAWLRSTGEGQPCLSDEGYARLTRAADLLERQAVPVAVDERPWEREGWCDEQGRCWWFNPEDPHWVFDDAMTCRHWADFSLPHNALPLPQGEVGE